MITVEREGYPGGQPSLFVETFGKRPGNFLRL
jgi:hypothetical protein